MSTIDKNTPVQRIVTYALLVLLGCGMLLPFAWLVRSSLCDDRTVIQPMEKASDFIPSKLHPENYSKVFDTIPFFQYLLNTVIITGSVIAGSVLSSSLCAYAFAFCKVPYRKKMFYAVLSTIMLPPVVTLIPMFIMFREVGWIDTFKPLIVPAFCGNAFAIFLFRQFFLGVPGSLIEAARIDGATNLQIWARIIMPLSKPVVVTVAIFSFMHAWNSFMPPLIYL
ncbi:MAG: carbohydrate ABC transporter permease, partial [Phycisphaerae bacterium]|nr:carbohydrate ABC transporter permease [Phycisphaerae bacterium]